MKVKIFLITSFVLATGAAGAAETIPTDKLPAPVKQALRKSGESTPVKDITVRSVEGKLVYDVELDQQKAPNPKLRIASDGNVLRDSRVDGVSELQERNVQSAKLENLPDAVQATVKREAAGREIGDIDREYWNGHAGYRVTVRGPGRNPSIYVRDDGSLERPTEKPPGARSLFAGPRFDDLPATVQQTIRREASGAEIVKVEESGVSAPDTFYRITLKNREGTFEMDVYQNGSILRDGRRGGNR
jgi:hypothetical protein